MYQQIFSKIRTKDELNKLIDELDSLLDSFYGKEKKFDEVIRSDVRSWVAQEIQDELKIVDDKNKSLGDFRESLSSLKLIKLTLAYEPSDEDLDLIASWVRENILPTLVLDVSISFDILGGVVVEYEGKYFDLSLAKAVSQELKNVATK
jgi:F0F1-type ATP synthase delta subunit